MPLHQLERCVLDAGAVLRFDSAGLALLLACRRQAQAGMARPCKWRSGRPSCSPWPRCMVWWSGSSTPPVHESVAHAAASAV